jgi:hypothetical protein
MAGSTITSHPAGARKTTTRRRPSPQRKSHARRRPAVAGSRKKKKPRRKRGGGGQRWWPALLLAAAVLMGVAWDSTSAGVPPVAGRCVVPGSALTVTAEQAGNAATIADVAHGRGLPDRAIVIALATAQQESRLRNLDHGDRDSVGLFQQRPSSGWGTAEQVQDPVYAAGTFYDHLVDIPGWDTGRLTDVAQAVQRSAFPEAYQQWEGMAQELTTALAGGGLGTLACS